jgi:hypothetical protein
MRSRRLWVLNAILVVAAVALEYFGTVFLIKPFDSISGLSVLFPGLLFCPVGLTSGLLSIKFRYVAMTFLLAMLGATFANQVASNPHMQLNALAGLEWLPIVAVFASFSLLSFPLGVYIRRLQIQISD